MGEHKFFGAILADLFADFLKSSKIELETLFYFQLMDNMQLLFKSVGWFSQKFKLADLWLILWKIGWFLQIFVILLIASFFRLIFIFPSFLLNIFHWPRWWVRPNDLALLGLFFCWFCKNYGKNFEILRHWIRNFVLLPKDEKYTTFIQKCRQIL